MKNFIKAIIIRNLFARLFAAVRVFGTPAKAKRISYMNIYEQGYYHRTGKPGTLNAHPGDLYDSYAAAKADVDPDAPYIATVGFEWDAPANIAVYGPDSVPVSLGITRKAFIAKRERDAILAGAVAHEDVVPAIEVFV
jgi:hypothetical protein